MSSTSQAAAAVQRSVPPGPGAVATELKKRGALKRPGVQKRPSMGPETTKAIVKTVHWMRPESKEEAYVTVNK
eukprot:1301515-Lingulodinium_polyedra.AAC.1